MDPKFPLNELRIATPCPADWGRMKGDERVRFCQSCGKHVYNIASMTSAEATELIQRTENRVCLRLSRRRDGTVITADCPVGIAAALNRRLKRLTRIAAAVLGLFGINSLLIAKEFWPYESLDNSRAKLDSWTSRLFPFGSSCRYPSGVSLIGETVGSIAPVQTVTPTAPVGPLAPPPAAPDPVGPPPSPVPPPETAGSR